MLDTQRLFQKLDLLGIAHKSVEHPPVFTVEEAKALRGELPGAHIKNLFLRNKKEEMWLVVALEDRASTSSGWARCWARAASPSAAPSG
jgi:Ala-tRNA(Pro) deacylase